MPGSPFQAANVLSGNPNPGTGVNQAGPVTLVKALEVYYDPTIKGIIKETHLTTAQVKKLASSVVSIKVSAIKQ